MLQVGEVHHRHHLDLGLQRAEQWFGDHRDAGGVGEVEEQVRAAFAVLGEEVGRFGLQLVDQRLDGLRQRAVALPILLSHQTEEWVRPGGFLPFCNQQFLGSDRPDGPLTERDGFHVNVSVGWASAIAGLLLWRRTPVPAVAVLWLEVGNIAMHTGMALHQHRYNPGVATAALLMGPHAVAGVRWMRRSGRLTGCARVSTAAAGPGSITALPLLMKIRMRRAARVSAHDELASR